MFCVLLQLRGLLRIGAAIDQTDEDGNTALHLAVITQAATTIKALLDAGANAFIKNSAGKTCMHLAAALCHIKILRLLIDAVRSSTERQRQVQYCHQCLPVI